MTLRPEQIPQLNNSTSIQRFNIFSKVASTHQPQFNNSTIQRFNAPKRLLQELAERYQLQIVYAFGSRGREALEFLDGRRTGLTPGESDLDVGIKPGRKLTVLEKVDLALQLEELFGVHRVDLVVLPEVSTFLALEAVSGELLFAEDLRYEAEYQLYIMRKAAELAPYRRMKERMVLGFES